MIIRVAGAIVGRVLNVRAHPKGDFIWLADVDLGDYERPVQIVFGGDRPDIAGKDVPVAPPGACATVRYADWTERPKKMRARNYRGQRSHGMLCSLDELGWLSGGPNEVATLQNLTLGQSLDGISSDKWGHVVVDWSRAQAMARQARSSLRIIVVHRPVVSGSRVATGS